MANNKAKVLSVRQKHTNQKDTYIGITENEFKRRYNQNTSSFLLPHKVHYNFK